MKYLLSILGLGALTASWMLFQLWVNRSNPGGEGSGEGCAGCGGCKRPDEGRLPENDRPV